MDSDFFEGAAADAPVLVVVINNPADFERAHRHRWYRIPAVHAPARIGADFLAFYQTAAFAPEERWAVRWLAPVMGYHLVTRRDLIPEEPDHPRAGDRYYQVTLGELTPLPHPIPSHRLRRITFIRTTLARLLQAREINDLWIRTSGAERLWQALQLAGLADQLEHEYPLVDDALLDNTRYTADFAVFGENERIAIINAEARQDLEGRVRDRTSFDYLLARGAWRAIYVDPSDTASIGRCVAAIRTICASSKAPRPDARDRIYDN